jgi:hypothetical protein
MTFRAIGPKKSEGNEYLNAIAQAKKAKPQASEYVYAEKDVILYSELYYSTLYRY